jgi:hypothetical protein
MFESFGAMTTFAEFAGNYAGALTCARHLNSFSWRLRIGRYLPSADWQMVVLSLISVSRR